MLPWPAQTTALAEVIIDLSQWGALRLAKAREFVQLRGTIFPILAAKHTILAEDVKYTLVNWLNREGLTPDCLRAGGLVMQSESARCSIPITAEAAVILLESNKIHLFSHSPDRELNAFTMTLRLLDSRGVPYPEVTDAPSKAAKGAEAYTHRRQMEALSRSQHDSRTFCVWGALPASMSTKNDAIVAAAKMKLCAAIRKHFSQAEVRTAVVTTLAGEERDTMISNSSWLRTTQCRWWTTSGGWRVPRTASLSPRGASLSSAAWRWEPGIRR